MGQIISIKAVAFMLLILFFNKNLSYGQTTVQEVIQTTLAENLQIKRAQFGYALSEQDLYQAKSNLYPNLNLGINNSYRNGLGFDQTSGALINGKWTNNANVNLSSNVAIFEGFQKVNQIKANRIQLLVDLSELERVKNDLVLQVMTNYLEAITNYELFEASMAQSEVSAEQLRLDSVQYAVGNKTLADLAQAENQVATDRLNSMQAKNSYDLSILALLQLMERPADAPLTLVKPDVDAMLADVINSSFQDVYQQALNSQPQIKQAQYQAQLAEKQIAIAKGAYYPSISIDFGYGTSYSSEKYRFDQTFMPFGEQLDENKSFNGGISLMMPIFNRNRTKVNVSKAQIGLLQAKNNESILQRTLQNTIAQALLEVKSTTQQYAASQTAFASAKVAFDVIRERYEVGMANAMELFTAQTNMNKTEFDMIRAKYIMVFRGKVIDYYMGNTIQF